MASRLLSLLCSRQPSSRLGAFGCYSSSLSNLNHVCSRNIDAAMETVFFSGVGPWRNEFSPCQRGLTELRAEMRPEPTIAGRGFKEVSTAECLALDPIQQPRFDLWTNRFEDVKGKRVTVGGVRMQTHAQAWVQT